MGAGVKTASAALAFVPLCAASQTIPDHIRRPAEKAFFKAGWTFLQSTCAIRIMYRRVEGRSLSKVDTFSFHRRHQCALQMPVGRSLRAGGLQNLKINCHTSEGLLNPAEQHLAAMESEIHLPYRPVNESGQECGRYGRRAKRRFPIGLHDMALRPVTRNRGDWLQSVAMHISRMPAAVTGVLRNPELVAAGGLPRMSEVCRCDKCFSRTVNGAGTVACVRRVIYTVASRQLQASLHCSRLLRIFDPQHKLIPLTFIQ